jgi:hypothetical protein
MSNVIQLQYGNNPISPSRVLNLSGGTDGIWLRPSGMAAAPGKEMLQWVTEPGGAEEGQKGKTTGRANAEYDITYTLQGSNPAHLMRLQSAVNRFKQDVTLRNSEGKTQAVWLRYRLDDGLGSKDEPLIGQWSSFSQIKHIEIPGWPRTFHSKGSLGAGIVESVVATLILEPLSRGIQCTAGLAVNRDSGAPGVEAVDTGVKLTDDDAAVTFALTTELSGAFTLAIWLEPQWASSEAGDVEILSYIYDGDNYVTVTWNGTTKAFDLDGEVGGVAFSDAGSARTFAAASHIHLALVNNTTTIALYVNGVLDAEDSAGALPASGTLSIGPAAPGDGSASGAIYDGLKAWDSAWAASDIVLLYGCEHAIKDAGGRVVSFPFVFTNGGTAAIDNGNDSTHAAWFGLSGVPGDQEASIEWRFALPSSGASDTYWLSRLAVDAMVADPAALLYVDLQGEVEASCSSGQYEKLTLGAPGDADVDGSLSGSEDQVGRAELVARMQVLKAATVTPFYSLSAGYRVIGNGRSLAVDTSGFRLRWFGDFWIRWPSGTPTTVTLGLNGESSESGDILAVDVLHLLPYPLCRATYFGSMSIAAGDVLVISGHEAWVEDSGGQPKYHLLHEGDAVGAAPGRVNYLFFVQAEEGGLWDIDLSATVSVKVTPRYLLPGGSV